MRHRCSNTAFGRTANQRKALFRGLMAAVIENERIETTVAKAKEARKLTEKMVTLGKKGDINSRRIAFSRLPNKKVIKKLFDDIAPRFSDRNGGYMRIIKTRNRLKDNAPLAVLEFVDYEEKNLPDGKQGKKKGTAPKKKAESKKETTQKKEEEKEIAVKKRAAKKKSDLKEETAEKKKTVAKKKTTTKKAAPKEANSVKKKTTAGKTPSKGKGSE